MFTRVKYKKEYGQQFKSVFSSMFKADRNEQKK